MRKMKSTFAGVVIAAGLLATFLVPQPAAASCFCGSERFSGSASAIGETCSAARNNLTNAIFGSADAGCQSRGFAAACNVVIRFGACTGAPPDNHVDGTFKYSCLVCFYGGEPEPEL